MVSIREHLLGRGLDPSRYSVILDEESGIATFLLWNLMGILAGYQQYNPNGTKQIRNDEKHRDILKYFTFCGTEGNVGHAHKKIVAWGFESFDLNQRIVFLAEGIFDAVKLHNAGYPALAVVSNDPKHLRSQLMALGRTIIAVVDSDVAGTKLGNCADHVLSVPSPYHDLGDMPQHAVDEFINGALSSLTVFG